MKGIALLGFQGHLVRNPFHSHPQLAPEGPAVSRHSVIWLEAQQVRPAWCEDPECTDEGRTLLAGDEQGGFLEEVTLELCLKG